MTRLFEGKLIAKCSDANLCSAQALQIGSIAQLVQSICLTSRGSGVRIPLLPQRSKTAISRLFHLYFNVLCMQPLPREHSSAGSEHLPYKQRVRGSNPFAPTENEYDFGSYFFCFMRFYDAEQRTSSPLFVLCVHGCVQAPTHFHKKQKPSAMLCIFARSHHAESKGITHINGVEPI